METDEKDGLVCNIGQFLENASHHLHIECQGSVSKVSLGQDDADADLDFVLDDALDGTDGNNGSD